MPKINRELYPFMAGSTGEPIPILGGMGANAGYRGSSGGVDGYADDVLGGYDEDGNTSDLRTGVERALDPGAFLNPQDKRQKIMDRRAEDMMKEVLQDYENLEVPEFGPIDLERYNFDDEAMGWDPVQISGRGYTANDQGPTAFEDISVDPRFRDREVDALDALIDLHENGGMMARDTANLSKIQNQVATADRGRRDAVMSNFQRRGQGGSGLELLAMLQSNQAATDRQSQQGLDIAAQMQDRALDALMRSGEMSSQIRAQDYGEQANKAKATDVINQFNTRNLNDAARYGADSFNRAQQFNANAQNRQGEVMSGRRMDVMNKNVDMANEQKKINQVDIPQRNFDNRRNALNDRANAKREGSKYYTGIGDREAAETANRRGGVMSIGGMFGKSMMGGGM